MVLGLVFRKRESSRNLMLAVNLVKEERAASCEISRFPTRVSTVLYDVLVASAV